MPVFVFECEVCKIKVDKLFWPKETVEANCDTCGQPMTQVVANSVGAKFKGGGFHVNDYPSNNITRGEF